MKKMNKILIIIFLPIIILILLIGWCLSYAENTE